MKHLSLVLLFCLPGAWAAESLQTKDFNWEEACGGSNIEITSVAGKTVLIDASVEHFAEGRQWVCHYADGAIVSAMYKHFKVKRVSSDDAGSFTTKNEVDVVRVFHFPDHRVAGLDPELQKDLLEVIRIAGGKAEIKP